MRAPRQGAQGPQGMKARGGAGIKYCPDAVRKLEPRRRREGQVKVIRSAHINVLAPHFSANPYIALHQDDCRHNAAVSKRCQQG
jgi:hypothetical protein